MAGPGPGPVGGEQPLSQSDERLWGMLAQLGGIILGFLSGLIVMLVFGKRSAFVNDQAKEALNFQITLIIGWVIAFVLSFLLIGFLLFPILWILNIVFCIIAGMANNRGEAYRYPFTLRLVK
ncbi:MAG TPA: DUF4870 domain-containing protein [Candidatus Nanopelagicales bacterium]